LQGKVGTALSLVDLKTRYVDCQPTIDNLLKDEVIPKGTRVLFIEALARLLPSGRVNDYRPVADFLCDMTNLCQKGGLTIIGTVHATKARARDLIFNPRERVLGSVAWGAFSETVIFIDPVEPTQVTNAERRVLMLPRNAPNTEHEFAFDPQGRLVPAKHKRGSVVLNGCLAEMGVGGEITRRAILDWAEASGVSPRTAEYWIASCVQGGQLEKVGRGLYRRL